MKRTFAIATVAALTAASAVAISLPAAAAPITTTAWNAQATSSIADVNLDVVGLIRLAGVAVGPTSSELKPSAPNAHAKSANLAATIVGLNIPLFSSEQQAPPANGAATTESGLAVTTGIVDLGAITTTNSANYNILTACNATGVLADSTTQLAGVKVAPLLNNGLISVGVASTHTKTTLQDGQGSNKNVVSTSSGRVAGVNLLGSLIKIEVADESTLSVDSATGSVNYNPSIVKVTYNGNTTTLTAAVPTFSVNTGVANVTISLNAPAESHVGNKHAASVALLTAKVDLLAVFPLPAVGSASIDLLPLAVSVDAPVEGVTCPPAAPVITSPANNSSIEGTTVPLTGTAAPGSTVTIFNGANQSGTTTAGPTGAWSYTTPTLAHGSYTFTATATEGGQTSAASSPVTVTLTADVTAPDAPTITSPQNNAYITTTDLVITGTAEVGSTVNVVFPGLGTSQQAVNNNGTWTLTVAPMPEGELSFHATATDGAGNTSQPSATVTVRKDTTPPAPPVITDPANGSAHDVLPTATGTAEAGSTVLVYLDGSGGPVLVGTALATGGTWSTPLSGTYPPGSYDFFATATDGAGNVSSSSATNSVRIKQPAPAVPVVQAPANGATVTTQTPTISGTGAPGTTVTVIVDGAPVGTALVSAGGEWQFIPSVPFVQGPHTVQAYATAADGYNRSADSAPSTFTIDITAATPPVITTPANGSHVASTTPAISGTASLGATVTITIDGTLVPGSVVATNGTWSIQAPALGQGQHTVVANSVDTIGRPAESTPVTFTVDTVKPQPPTITVPGTSPFITNQQSVAFEGTAEPGSTVHLLQDGVAIDSALANATTGSWQIAVSGLIEGSSVFTATSQDTAGNESDPSNAVTVIVDLTPPAAPAITAPANNTVTNQLTLAVTGTTEPGTTVKLSIDGAAPTTITPNAQGGWTSGALSFTEGVHTASAIAVDAAGNESLSSPVTTFTIDRTPPAAPDITTPAAGAHVASTTPLITGTTEVGATVAVSIDGTFVGNAAVDGSGNWSITSPILTEGEHTITAVATDQAGNISPTSSRTFTVDVTAPEDPEITAPVTGATLNTQPVIEGNAEALSEVKLFLGGNPLGSTFATGAGTFTYPASGLADGTYTVTARAIDSAGNSSGLSNAVTFTIDTSVPAAPVITAPADGTVTNNTTIAASGTTQPGTVVTLFLNGSAVGTVQAAPGFWTAIPQQNLADGEYTLTAVARNAAGTDSAASAAVTVTIDTVDPAAPSITWPTAGSTIATLTPTITGEGEAGSDITVTLGSTTLGPVTVNQAGTWSLPVTTPLTEGQYTATPIATDAAGNTATGASVSFTVDVTPPDDPTITAPAEGAAVQGPDVEVSGTAEPNIWVVITVDGTPAGTVAVDGSGNWSTTLEGLLDGTHTITATAVDAAGLQSDPVTRTFTVDTVPSDAPVIEAPAHNEVITTSTITISGTSEPGTTVTVSLPGVPTALTNNTGAWSIPNVELEDGNYTITATAVDPAGNISDASDPVSFTIDTVPLTVPVITAPADGSIGNVPITAISGTARAGSSVVVAIENGATYGPVVAGTTGAWSVTVAPALHDGTYRAQATSSVGTLSTVSAGVTFTVDTVPPAVPVITAPETGDILNTNAPTVTGTGEEGSFITIDIPGVGTFGPVTVGSDETWSIPTTGLPEGEITITPTATDPAGNAVVGAPVGFTVDTIDPEVPVITSPTPGSSINTDTPTITGTGEPGTTITVVIPGIPTLGPVTVDEEGNWSIEVPALPDGTHTATPTATDGAGNTSVGEPVTFTVDTEAPDAPTITSPANGSTIGGGDVIVSGTAEPGSTVTVTVDGVVIDTVPVGEDGNWSINIGELPDGTHTVTATATDAAGNTSEPTTNTFVVDSEASDAPVITSPAHNAHLPSGVIDIAGTAEPGTTITLSLPGTESAVTGENGSWVVPGVELADGTYTVTATATDGAGNESEPSDPVTFTIDTVAPIAPVITSPENHTFYRSVTVIKGTGEPGATVTVQLDVNNDPWLDAPAIAARAFVLLAVNDGIGTTTVASDGTWSLTVPTTLQPDTYRAVASQSDAAGNVSEDSEAVYFGISKDNTGGGNTGGGNTGGNGGTNPSPAPGGNGGNGTLPATGGPVSLWLLGLAVIVVGLGITLRRRGAEAE